MRLQSAHFQTNEGGAPPSPKYVIPSFRKPPLSQEPAIHELQSATENKEETTEPKEEDPILLFEKFSSFVEEIEDNKVVPPLEEKVMAFEPLPLKEDLLLEEEENHLLQQTTLYDVEDGQEGLKDSFVLEEEYANLHEVSPQPMHVFETEIEEINDEDDLLDELDALCSSMDIELVSPIHEEHVL